jgi:hypothetical protein
MGDPYEESSFSDITFFSRLLSREVLVFFVGPVASSTSRPLSPRLLSVWADSLVFLLEGAGRSKLLSLSENVSSSESSCAALASRPELLSILLVFDIGAAELRVFVEGSAFC